MANSDGGARLSLADKINHLFDTVVPAGRQPYNTEEVARAITETGIPISGSYIWLLRKGQRDNPTLKHLEGIAAFFGVPPAYFFNDQVASDVHAQLALLAALRDSNVQHVALRAAGLSSASLNSISELIEHVRALEGLPQSGPTEDEPAGAQDS
ncbi:helix-turn-helix domain-containing protein [Streptomyces sp. NPDC006463]|uniref:helix-turn-helix domain-containing protein n=1 Tax=Streptomyces sp. NPDC006463 TaxID=3364746 RepID=UPI0036839E34